jgi:hypothetical protein
LSFHFLETFAITKNESADETPFRDLKANIIPYSDGDLRPRSHFACAENLWHRGEPEGFIVRRDHAREHIESSDQFRAHAALPFFAVSAALNLALRESFPVRSK